MTTAQTIDTIPDFDPTMIEAADDREVIVYGPQPGPQAQFLSCGADIAWYGGAAGGGKSFALLLDALRWVDLPGTHALVLRRTVAAAKKSGSIWSESQRFFGLVGGRPNISTLTWEWRHDAGPTSTIAFSGIEHESDLEQSYQGGQYHIIGFDELTHFTERMFWYMRGRARNPTKHEIQPCVRATMNPEPDSWIHRTIEWWLDADGFPIPERSGVIRYIQRYQDANIWGDTIEECATRAIAAGMRPADCLPNSFTFISARLEDNPILMRQDPGYAAALAMQTESDRIRLRDGCWKADHSRKLFAPLLSALADAVRPDAWASVVLVDAARGRKDADGRSTGHATGIVVARVAATPLGVRVHVVYAEHWRGSIADLPAHVVRLADAHTAQHVALDGWSAATNDTLAKTLTVHEVRTTEARELEWARDLQAWMQAGRVALDPAAVPCLADDLVRIHESSGKLVVPEYATPEGIVHCDAAVALLRLVPVVARITLPEEAPPKPQAHLAAVGDPVTSDPASVTAWRPTRAASVRTGTDFRGRR